MMPGRRFILFGILLVLVFQCTACIPPNYTKEKKEQVAADHYQDAVDWFANYDSNITVAETCRAFSTMEDLYAAVTGSYTVGDVTYQYVYDYHNEEMYSTEKYEEVCKLIEEEVTLDFYLPKDAYTFIFNDYTFTTLSENDSFRGAEEDRPEFLEGNLEKMVPLMADSWDTATKILLGEAQMPFSVNAYVDIIPGYSPEKMSSYPNFNAIRYFTPIDCTEGYNGVCYARFGADKEEYLFCHIEQLQGKKVEKGKYYIGYFCEMTEDFSDDFELKNVGKKSFDMKVPAAATTVVFTNEQTEFEVKYKDDSKNTKKANATSFHKTDCPGWEDCAIYGGKLMIKDTVSYGYRRSINSKFPSTVHFTYK